MKKIFGKKFLLSVLITISCLAGAMFCVSCDKTNPSTKEENPTVQFVGFTREELSSTAVESVPVTGISVSANSNGKMATSTWKTSFETDSLQVTAWVKDSLLLAGTEVEDGDFKSDGVCLYVSTVSTEQGYVVGKTVKIFVKPNGDKYVYVADTKDSLAENSTTGITSSTSLWEQTAGSPVGYKVVINVPYNFYGLDSTNAKSQISIAPTLFSASSRSMRATIRSYKLNEFGIDLANQNTYLVATGDNALQLNSEPYPTGTFNVHYDVDNTYSQHTLWDLSKDYLESDVANYNNRVITLNDSKGTSNEHELYFYKAKGTVNYAEATFSAKDIYYNDTYPKFGLSIKNDSKNWSEQSGVYFYVDAKQDGNGNITGTSVGCVNYVKRSMDWTNAQSVDGYYNSATPIKLALYRNGADVKMLVNDVVVFTVETSSLFSETTPLCITLYSWNIGLEVTNYMATNDVNHAKIQALSGTATAYAGTNFVNVATLDSSSANINFDTLGKLDYTLYGQNASLVPYANKVTATKRYFGSLSVSGGTFGTMPDFLYSNSSLTYGGTTKNGNVPAITLLGAGSTLKYELNAYANQNVTYNIYLGTYSAIGVVELKDSAGNTLNSCTLPGRESRTVVCYTVDLQPTANNVLTLNVTLKESIVDAAPQIWFMGANALNTSDNPSGLVGASPTAVSIQQLNRSIGALDLTAEGNKDWIHYSNLAGDRNEMANNFSYFDTLTVLNGNNDTMPDFFTNSTLTYTNGTNPATYTGTAGNVSGTLFNNGGHIILKINIPANEEVRIRVYFGIWGQSWGGSAVARVYDANGTNLYRGTNLTKFADNTQVDTYGNITHTGNPLANLDFVVTGVATAQSIYVDLATDTNLWLFGALASNVPSNVPSNV